MRVFLNDHGLLGGYVQGAHSREKRPLLIPANEVAAELRARSDAQLPSLSLELIHSRGPLMREPLAAAALTWLMSLTTQSLPEGHPYPRLHDMLVAVLAAIEAAPNARGWVASLVRFELMLLAELGFGLDLHRCAVTGSSTDLRWVSPRSGRAVSAGAGQHYAEKLLRLPPFLRDGASEAAWADVLAGLALTGHFIERNLLSEDGKVLRMRELISARGRLVDRLKKAAA